MTSSPACWAAFGKLLAREYSDPELWAVHRLSVDAWAVQHPGDGSRRAVQSMGLHLARLMVQLEDGCVGRTANDAMLHFAKRKSTLPILPPRTAYPITVADVAYRQTARDHIAGVRRWAQSVWDQWSDHHHLIRRWTLDV